MPESLPVPLIVSAVSGGAMGAILTALVSTYRSRRQPVGYRVTTIPIFRPTDDQSLAASITLGEGSDQVSVRNLYVVEVALRNSGNRDVEAFSFGVTLADGDRAVFAQFTPPDRHHKVVQSTSVSPQSPASEMDFEFQPFNRSDEYTLKLYLVTPDGKEEPGELQLGSPLPVAFRSAVSTSAAAALVKGVEVGLPLLRIKF